MKAAARLVLAFAVLWVAGARDAGADVVHLTNGRRVEGTITKSTDREVVVDFGVGSTTIKRSRIRRIEKTAAKVEEAAAEVWRQKYFAHDKYAPPAYRDIAGQYRRLAALRDSSLSGYRKIPAWRAHARTLDRDFQDLQREQLALSSRLRSAVVDRTEPGSVDAYNALVAEVNELNARLHLNRAGLEKNKRNISAASAGALRYLDELERFRRDVNLAVEASEGKATPSEESFLSRLAGEVARLGADIHDHKVTVADRRGVGMVVSARINGRSTAKFLVDTGASVVTISAALAARLALDVPAGTAKQKIHVADGRVVEAVPIILSSLAVGDARAEDVGAVIMPGEPSPGVDGLLGMSFLGNFVVRMDPGSDTLILRGLGLPTTAAATK